MDWSKWREAGAWGSIHTQWTVSQDWQYLGGCTQVLQDRKVKCLFLDDLLSSLLLLLLTSSRWFSVKLRKRLWMVFPLLLGGEGTLWMCSVEDETKHVLFKMCSMILLLLKASVLRSVQEITALSQHGHIPIKTSFFALLCWPEQVKCFPVPWPKSVLCPWDKVSCTLLSIQCVYVSSRTISGMGESSIELKKKDNKNFPLAFFSASDFFFFSDVFFLAEAKCSFIWTLAQPWIEQSCAWDM